MLDVSDIYSTLVSKLQTYGINIIKSVDISSLPQNMTSGYNFAILIAKFLDSQYLNRLLKENSTDTSGFSQYEKTTDDLADWTADFINSKGFKAYSQSEKSNEESGRYKEILKRSLLPHKTIALMAGMGWIGKSNLLVTEKYGSAISMCTILTDLPLPKDNGTIAMPKCNDCNICKNICQYDAVKGNSWHAGIDRNMLIDVNKCQCCLKCMVFCQWTRKYIAASGY